MGSRSRRALALAVPSLIFVLPTACSDASTSGWRGTNLSRVYVSPGSSHAVVRCVRARDDPDDDVAYTKTSWQVVDLRAGSWLDLAGTTEGFAQELALLDASYVAFAVPDIGPTMIFDLATGRESTRLTELVRGHGGFIALSPSGRWAALPDTTIVEMATLTTHEGFASGSTTWLPGDRLLVRWASPASGPTRSDTTELGVWNVNELAAAGFARDADGLWAGAVVRTQLHDAFLRERPLIDTEGRVAAWSTLDRVERLDIETADVRTAAIQAWPVGWAHDATELVMLPGPTDMVTYDRVGLRRSRAWPLPAPAFIHVPIARGRYLLGVEGGGPESVVLTDVERGESVVLDAEPIMPSVQTAESAGATELWLPAWDSRERPSLYRVSAVERFIEPVVRSERLSAVAYSADEDAFVALEVECRELVFVGASSREVTRRIALSSL